MKLIGSGSKHTGEKIKFGKQWTWIHWIKPDGGVVIVATPQPITTTA